MQLLKYDFSLLFLLQKPPKELGLKRFWSAVRSSNSSSSSQCEQGGDSSAEDTKPPPNCSLPLLQVSHPLQRRTKDAETQLE